MLVGDHDIKRDEENKIIYIVYTRFHLIVKTGRPPHPGDMLGCGLQPDSLGRNHCIGKAGALSIPGSLSLSCVGE
jgi:hypothetical protein